MKIRMFSLLIAIALIASLFGVVSPVKAVAYGASFTTSVTYMNVGTSQANVTMLFYAAGSGTPVTWNEPPLPVHAAASLFAGTVFGGSFSGSAVVSSDSPLAVTGVQTSTTVKNRMLSNGFSSGSATFTIPTILKNTFNTNSIFSVQNADSVAADITVTFTPTSGSPFSDVIPNLPAGAAKIYDMGTAVITGLGATFNGTAKITAVKDGTSTPGSVVASSQELGLTNDNAYAFEGVATGSSIVYMPSAFCSFGTGGAIQSAYAVMNVGTVAVDVTVAYASPGHTQAAVTIQPNSKASFQGCGLAPNANPAGYIGSATITAVVTGGGAGTPSITAIGKIGGSGLSTAFSGVGAGSQVAALPYVRWTNLQWTTGGSRQRVNIAIQNVGGAQILAGQVAVAFYDADGVLKGTINNPAAIPVGGKWSTNASSLAGEYGYWATKTGGGAIVTGPAGSLAVIARASTFITATTSTGEDYNGIPLP